MDTRETLASLAKALTALPPDNVESTLLTFGTLMHFGEQEHRTEAAGFLREAAERCADPERQERLLRAAAALAAGEPLALTPEGQQAAAAQTIGIDEWAEPPEPGYPPEEPQEEDEDDDLAEPDELAELEDEFEEDER
jgi:hypothetical protein